MITEKHRDTKFIVIIPVVILVISFFFDFGLNYIQEKRVELATEAVVKEVLTTNVSNYRERVKTLYEKKKVMTEHLEVDFTDGILKIDNSHAYPSFFGKLLGTNTYRIEIHILAHLEGDKIIIEEISNDE